MDQTPAYGTSNPLTSNPVVPTGEEQNVSQPPLASPPFPLPPTPLNPDQSISLPDPLPEEHPILAAQDMASVNTAPTPPLPVSQEPLSQTAPSAGQPQVVAPFPPPPPASTYYLPTEEINTAENAGGNAGGPKHPWFTSRLVLAPLVVLIALGIVGAVSFLSQKNTNKQQTPALVPTQPVSQKPTPTISQKETTGTLTLSVISPVEGGAFATNEITTSGKTSSNTLVVFFTKEDQNSVESSPSGDFKGQIKLAQGTNDFVIAAIAVDGKEKREQRRILYSTDAAAKLATGSATAEASSSAGQTIGQKQLTQGFITGINGSVVTLLQKTPDEQYYNFEVDNQTVIKARGGKVADVKKLNLGDRIAVVGVLKDYNTFSTKLIHVVGTSSQH